MPEEFDPLRYIASYPDLIRVYGADPVAGRWHWEHYGRAEGRDPFRFNPFLYGASNPDLIGALGSYYTAYTDHYIRQGYGAGRPTSSFDHLGYSASNSDLVVVFGTNANGLAQHYIDFGFREGRSFSRVDGFLYGASNPDVAAVVGDDRDRLLGHYINYGFYERRPTTGFDPVQYVAANRDLLQFGYLNYPNEALHHYLKTGADEGRPTDFDERAYLLSYQDVAALHLTEAQALTHWTTIGVGAGRAGDILYGHDQTSHTLTGGTATAAFERPNDRDWFEVDLVASKSVAALLTGPGGQALPATLSLHDRFGVLLATDSLLAGEDVASLDYVPSTAGRYYLSVASAHAGAYKLEVSQAWATLNLAGRSYADADFQGLPRTRYLLVADTFETRLGPNAQAAGIRIVTATDPGASVTDASAYTTGLTVNVDSGGDDTVRTGSGNDLVNLGAGAQTISLGAGNDVVQGTPSSLHRIDGGPGYDTLRLTGYSTVDLSRVSNVERIESGDYYSGSVLLMWPKNAPAAPTHYQLVGATPFVGPPFIGGFSFGLGPYLDGHLSFDVTSNEITSLTFYKFNDGMDNVINFTGNVQKDTFVISASDLKPNITADGGPGAENSLSLRPGVATDTSFTQLSRFQKLYVEAVDVSIGATAREMGLTSVFIQFWRGTNRIFVEPGFGRTLEVTITSDHEIQSRLAADDWITNLVDASQSTASLVVNAYAHELDETETIRGSGFATDVLNIRYDLYKEISIGGYAPVTLTNVTGIETVNVSFVNESPDAQVASHGWIYIDTKPEEIQAARQTITVVGAKGNPEDLLYAPIDASAATADLAISGALRVKSGSGNDTVTALATAPSIIETGAGNDTVTGGNLVDMIDAGPGNDILFGGPGADQLDLGSGNDRLRYAALTNSAGTQSDTVLNFASGSDVVDLRSLQGFAGKTIAFAGNAATLAAAQALLTPGDGTLDAVFQQDAHSLWIDNGDGVLDAFDLHIVLTGVASLAGADVLHGSVVIG